MERYEKKKGFSQETKMNLDLYTYIPPLVRHRKINFTKIYTLAHRIKKQKISYLTLGQCSKSRIKPFLLREYLLCLQCNIIAG